MKHQTSCLIAGNKPNIKKNTLTSEFIFKIKLGTWCYY